MDGENLASAVSPEKADPLIESASVHTGLRRNKPLRLIKA